MHAVSRIVLLVPVFLQILSVLSLVFVNKKPEKVNYTIFQRAGHLQLYSGSCNLLKRMVVFKCVGYGNTKALFFFYYYWNCPFGYCETILHKCVFCPLFLSVHQIKPSVIALQILFSQIMASKNPYPEIFILLDLLNMF